MVKDHSDNESRNPLLLLMSYSFLLASRDLLYRPSHRIHFVTPVVEQWLEQEIYIMETKLSNSYSLNISVAD